MDKGRYMKPKRLLLIILAGVAILMTSGYLNIVIADKTTTDPDAYILNSLKYSIVPLHLPAPVDEDRDQEDEDKADDGDDDTEGFDRLWDVSTLG